MNKVSLPSMVFTFHINEKGSDTGTIYDGDFTYQKPNIGKQVEISKMSTRLNGDLKNLPVEVQFFNQMCSSLFHCITEAPKWWKDSNGGLELYDANIIERLYEKTREFENEWTKKVWGDKKEDVEVKTE